MPPVLDRIPRFDERSRRYPVVRALRRPTPLASMFWRHGPMLDQGEEGACVGFGWSAELAAEPVPVDGVSDMYAQNLYSEAVAIDLAEGNDFGGTGASVLAGAKACSARGLIREYRWAFSIDDVLQSLMHIGPVVLGIPWYESMYDTDANGIVEVAGDPVGGHCLTAVGLDAERKLVIWQNSWGTEYGMGGLGGIHIAELERLLSDNGEACVPVRRAMGPEPEIAEPPVGDTPPTPGIDDRPGCNPLSRAIWRR